MDLLELLENVIVLVVSCSCICFIDKLFWKRMILQNKDLFFDLYRDRILEAFEEVEIDE